MITNKVRFSNILQAPFESTHLKLSLKFKGNYKIMATPKAICIIHTSIYSGCFKTSNWMT